MKKLLWLMPLLMTLSTSGFADFHPSTEGLCKVQEGGWQWYRFETLINGLCAQSNPAEALQSEGSSSIVTNNSVQGGMWVSIYDVFGQILDSGCVAKNGSRIWNSQNYKWGSIYRIRGEFKQDPNCRGDTFNEASYEVILDPAKRETVLSTLLYNGNSYYWANGNGFAGPANVPQLPQTSVAIYSRLPGGFVLSVNNRNPNCQRGGNAAYCEVNIQKYRQGDLTQLWVRMYSEGGVMFRNVANDMNMNSVGTHGEKVELRAPDQLFPPTARFTYAGDCQVNCAIRPMFADSLNLNVLGGEARNGSLVGFWNWSGGEENETWYMVETRPKPFVIHSRVDSTKVLSIKHWDDNCITAASDFRCPIVIDDYKSGLKDQLWDREGSAGNYSFRNRQTGKLLYAEPGNGGKTTLVKVDPLDGGARWTTEGDCAINCAMRPLRDDSQNLNVFGNAPYLVGNPVGTWDWMGGYPNETWYLVPQ